MGKRVVGEMQAAALPGLPVGVHAVGGVSGLLVRVWPNGSRSFILRQMVDGKRRDMGLGGWPSTSLADARRKAREAREMAAAGGSPIEARAQAVAARAAAVAQAKAEATTFAQCAAAYIEAKSGEWANAKHASQWSATLTTYAFPVIGHLPVGAVETSHVLTILKPLWATKTETAVRLRGRIEAVLGRARVLGLRSGDNPARWRDHLDNLLAKPSKVRKVEHHAAVPWQEMPQFWQRLQAADGMGARALQFTILTAARSGEVRGATWGEIDTGGKVWTVPASRMKAGKVHSVPLSPAALAVLGGLPAGAPDDLVFPGAKRGRALSDMTLAAVLRRLKTDATVHGFRSSFRDWAGAASHYPYDVIEHALAHAVGGKVERSYARDTLFDKRVPLMADWAAYVAGA